MRFSHISLGALALAIATPALADPLPAAIGPVVVTPDATVTLSDTSIAGDGTTAGDDQTTEANSPAADAPAEVPKAFTVTGGITLVSDYRFRGLTQSDEKPAVQPTLNLNHSSGLYIGVWASTIDGGLDGSTPLLTGYGFAEVDLYGGFTKTLPSGFGFDVGLLYYLYPDRAKGLNTDFFEPYASINYTIGPVNAKVGGAYAWGGQDGLNFTTGSDDNIYVYGELSGAIPNTPITLKSHLGYTNGSLGLANTTADDSYFDWSLTAEALIKGHFKIGVSYIDTDVTNRKFGIYTKNGFAQTLGRGATAVGYIGFTF